MCKEGFGSFAVRNLLNKTMPLIHPVVTVALATLFVPMYTGDREVTRLTPDESASQGLPEARIKKRFFRGYDERGLVIFSRPRGIVVRGSLIVSFHPVRSVYVIPAFHGFVYGFLDSYSFSLFFLLSSPPA